MKTKAPAGMSRTRKKKRVNRQDLTLRNLTALHKRLSSLEHKVDDHHSSARLSEGVTMTYYALLKYKSTGHVSRVDFSSEQARALCIIALGSYVKVLEEGTSEA